MKTLITHPTFGQTARYLFAPKISYQLVTGLLLASFTVMSPAAWAQQYQPPAGDPPSGPVVSNGTRDSCGENYEIPLTVLAPAQHVGQTTSTTPTLAWFAPATPPYRIKLSLYRVNEDQSPELLQQIEYVENASGLVRFTLPEDEFQLSSGQRYLWEVSLACTPDSPIYDQAFVSQLDIRDPSASLVTALATAQTPLEKAEIYAEAGYWYDALREALIASDHSGTDTLVKSLLHELAELEDGIHGQFLTEIMETLRACQA
ncbi:MAG: DUF928 domain-containing protein [Leptolyngbya sp. SIO1D8]|nr:DUF928 domain-containing protein [Leptolyngbya sp. SIO1D8]